jgi:hypothetical protein
MALQPLSLPAVTRKPDEPSTLVVPFAVDRAFIDEGVARQPLRLHEAKNRSIGHGFKLDLAVTRGDPQYGLKGDTVEIHFPFEVSIDVHRKLGPIELDLGHCSPTVVADAKINPWLTPDASINRPALGLELREPCRLSGIDVSEYIEQELAKQRKHIEHLIQEQVEILPLFLSTRIAELERPLDETDARCPRLDVDQVLQSPIKESSGVYSASLSAKGKLTHLCGNLPNERPHVERVNERPAFDIAERLSIDLATLSRAIDPILSQHALSNAPIQLRAVRTPAGDRLALGITGSTQSGWAFAQVTVKNQDLRITIESSDNPAMLSQTQIALSELRVPLDLGSLTKHAKQLFASAQGMSQVMVKDANLRDALSLKEERLETSTSVQIEPEGVSVWLHRREKR